MVVKKGGDMHIKVGKFYVRMMWVVVATAIMMSVINVVQGKYLQALFLGYLSVITANPLWYGIAILKHGRHLPDSLMIKRKYFEMLVFILALFNISIFIYYSGKGPTILLLIFGLLGLSSARSAFAPLNKLREKAEPLINHIEGMVTTGIAAYTAFFAFGGSRLLQNLFEGFWMVLFWTMPTVIDTIAIRYYKRKYKRKTRKAPPVKRTKPAIKAAELAIE
jgi:hypothetical protein